MDKQWTTPFFGKFHFVIGVDIIFNLARVKSLPK